MVRGGEGREMPRPFPLLAGKRQGDGGLRGSELREKS